MGLNFVPHTDANWADCLFYSHAVCPASRPSIGPLLGFNFMTKLVEILPIGLTLNRQYFRVQNLCHPSSKAKYAHTLHTVIFRRVL